MVYLAKRLNRINGNDLIRMVEKGAQQLRENMEQVNALNVFPVPDGDTGTNMNLTFTSGVEELRRRPSAQIGKAAEAMAKGLLMGARGNSGVILSQLFRGFSKAVADADDIDSVQFAAALQNGVDMAYRAVVKPVEGTILTVSKEAAKQAVQQAGRATDMAELMKEVCLKGNAALSKTPDLLPVLKQVGVVDAGGQGLMFIYEGFLQALEQQVTGAAAPGAAAAGTDAGGAKRAVLEAPPGRQPHSDAGAIVFDGDVRQHSKPQRAQAKLATKDIEFGYCTEFMVTLQDRKLNGSNFDELAFRQELSELGDSLLVVADDDLVKVHIHAEYPGSVMNLAMKYGDLSRIKIENMRDQHTHILLEEAGMADGINADSGASGLRSGTHPGVSPHADIAAAMTSQSGLKPFGFVAVSAGQGISDIFASLGVDQVLAGGQTMNPSTEDILSAIRQVRARTVFILPNNSNIAMAAQQAAELIDDKQVIVILTKTIPQGMAAVLSLREDATAEMNAEAMNEAIGQVQSGLVTFAVRDTRMDDMEIKQGDYIGIHNGRIVTAEPDLTASAIKLVDSLMAEGAEIVTIYTGEEADPEQTERIVHYIEQSYSDAEVEVHAGGQPLYYYIISAE
ncbi:DAK2 domain-containing protein [Paenibacillus piri]|uniref:DAK2 domain-containing protein n=1 Tax=Paenibacillus piri TaxID=2547395 RepID=A0A4R5KTS7_9BACL|nr:DAK2 domain-containing protein [Paenibacillus piri]TDF98300.1 DAK2 domain-containing protein [Paenibacillus piri]